MEEFYFNLSLSFLGAAILYYFMHRAQKRKEAEAEAQFQRTLQMIELRNRKIGDKNESV
jgi:hypothetical protein